MHTTISRSLLLMSCAATIILSGCRKAAVERTPTQSAITPSLNAGDPAYILRPKNEEKAPWYRELQVIFDQRPEDEQQLEAHINAHRDPINLATTGLLNEIASGVESQRRPQDRWSLLTGWCGRTKKGGEITFIADVGLTRVFTRRPAIAFQQLPLELAVAKLARESGITDSVPRGYSPLVTWSETDISVKEAYDAFLPKYGFERKYTDIQGRITLRIQDYASRKDFVTSAVNAILAEGKRLNAARGGIIVTPKDTSPQTEKPAESKESKPRSHAPEPAK